MFTADFGEDHHHPQPRVREAPDCGLCYDHLVVQGGRLNRWILRRHWVPCPSCDPTWIIRAYQRSRLWRIRGWLRMPTRGRAAASDDVPF